MPDQRQPGTSQMVALALLMSAIALGALSGLIYAGTVPLAEEIRGVAALAVGAAAGGDLLIGLWFFRRGRAGAPHARSGRDGVASS
jgi:hypothetical protein